MCARGELNQSGQKLAAAFGLNKVPEQLPLLHNIAPTDPISIVRTPGELELVRFGLMPPFVNAPSAKFINARAETVATLPVYRDAFKLRRCIVVLSAFFEWKAIPNGTKKPKKQPFRIALKNGEPLGLAGIWERWLDRVTGEMIDSCAIITIPARPPVSELHDRQPLILEPGAYAKWIDPANDNPSELLSAVRQDELALTAVNPAMNNARNKSPEASAPIAVGE